MSFPFNLRGLASRLLNLSRPIQTTTAPSASRCLSTTSPLLNTPKGGKKPQSGGAASGKKRGKGKNAVVQDPKIVNLLQSLSTLSPRRIPPPLRMARNRHLRHWTIHRGWLMFRRKQRDERERTFMKQYQSMSAACEELRLTRGPGARPEGYLYRVAMEKKGVYGHHGVPIEYARAQTDTPAKVAWNHDWKR
ncbi:hypothetical protein B0T16DRAFT_419936 [Cercophora newfieldiana]|uniref:Uncharacterized protein n=1 Tax=Cercophora newfieldiana TaxID=92897 RepID=A0AA39XXA8_9PEZI|nr:hypothetical protein B0T16DRAFT_419936 [Cercophora newfieldiana]